MAVSGLLFVLFLLAHMLGNLKIFAGAAEFNEYGMWLRTLGEPMLSYGWFLWIQRVVLLVALVAHIVAAAQLSLRDRRARPVRYTRGQRVKATFATRTMRWGGIILALFIVWHILDLTVGAVNPDFRYGEPHHNVVVGFEVWWINVIYIVAMVMLGLHINHGFWSAAQTLGVNRPARQRVIKTIGSTLAVVLTVGFVIVPVAVMTGVVS
ncbi:succinate dehydrogenase [Saccharomonospora sp. CUA-673]|uniref:succinate dehydrogenase cytochrome b subunit n=1 Tax=Saccharomonospora sp. CUA-673 TaxID=1904969 RepID=UPI0009698833|nr:succinate dehydrogenase cytochrome b subunit [Saccharomonospora sp. CUA-673]OLT48802.1 succinate dehydrogenase [Saccharomonospora sp. CUA-673]